MRQFLPFLALLLVIAAFLRVEFFFTIVYFLLLLYLASRWWVHHDARRVKVWRRLDSRAFTGDRVPVEIAVENEGVLPVPWVELDESIPTDLGPVEDQNHGLSLGGHERSSYRYTLHCRKRGYYLVGPLRMRTGDLLGIGQRMVEWNATPLIVYPRVVPLQRLGLPTRSALVALPARSPLFEDPARVIGIRPYRRGDSPRRINWKASARTGDLLVKQFQPAIARETLICLDMSQERYAAAVRYDAIEWGIVVAASVAQHVAVAERLPIGMATEAWDPITDSLQRFQIKASAERTGLMSILEVLARIQPVTGGSLSRTIQEHSARLAWGSTMLVISGSADVDLIGVLGESTRRGLAVALILVQPERLSREILGQAELLRVAVHRVWTDRELEALA